MKGREIEREGRGEEYELRQKERKRDRKRERERDKKRERKKQKEIERKREREKMEECELIASQKVTNKRILTFVIIFRCNSSALKVSDSSSSLVGKGLFILTA